MHTLLDWGDWHRDSVLRAVRAVQYLTDRLGLPARHEIHEPSRCAGGETGFDAGTIGDSDPPHALARHTGAYQRVSPEVTLKAMTIWAAWQHFEEDRKGSIEVGKLADFVVMSGNPQTVPLDQLETLQIIETIKEGVNICRMT